MNEIRSSKAKRFIQTVTTLPNFISWIVVYGIAFMFFSSHGVLNDALKAVGLTPYKHGLIADKDAAYLFHWALGWWKGAGWGAIIYMAAIAGIDTELYDASKVDGADRLHLIRHITLPGILPTYVVMLLLSVGSILSTGFDQFFMFRNAYFAERVDNLDYYVYYIAFGADALIGGDYSYSIALGIMKSLIGIVLLFITNRIAKIVRGNTLI